MGVVSKTGEKVTVSIEASPACKPTDVPLSLKRQPIETPLIKVKPQDEVLSTLVMQELGVHIAVQPSRPNYVNEQISAASLLGSLLNTDTEQLVRLKSFVGTKEDPSADVELPVDILMVIRSMQAFLGMIKEVSFSNPPPIVPKTVNEFMRW